MGARWGSRVVAVWVYGGVSCASRLIEGVVWVLTGKSDDELGLVG